MAAPSRREPLVEAALRLFMRDGIHATGIAAVLDEAGVSKMTLYGHFASKEALVLAALELRDRQFREWLLARMAELGGEPRGQLLALFDALAEWFRGEAPIGPFLGCAFVNAAAEYGSPADPVHRLAARHKGLVLDHIETLAASAGFTQASALARQLILLKEGAIAEAHVRGNLDAAGDARAVAAFLVERAR
ncbi:MAG: helix-turn-helix domain containing protein [Magnetospirillum sp.]|nr:helix-turn-helix domain containing protein [Magnetospirillum sp.]